MKKTNSMHSLPSSSSYCMLLKLCVDYGGEPTVTKLSSRLFKVCKSSVVLFSHTVNKEKWHDLAMSNVNNLLSRSGCDKDHAVQL